MVLSLLPVFLAISFIIINRCENGTFKCLGGISILAIIGFSIFLILIVNLQQ